ncbi:MAG: hypothetical protein AB1705_21405 [Verrucomicrobiota bacterium]
MKHLLALFLTTWCAQARLGENRDELVVRLGPVRTTSKHSIIAQGQISALGQTFVFEKDGWHIQCDMIGDRCARINYSKKGDWTPEQVATLLENNTQSHQWTEDADSQKQIRKWTRSDRAVAKWQFTGVMELTSPAYFAAKTKREAELKEKATKKPDL